MWHLSLYTSYQFTIAQVLDKMQLINCSGSSVIRNKTVVLKFLTMTSIPFKTAMKIICPPLCHVNIEIRKFTKNKD